MQKFDARHLPPSLLEIADHVGVAAAIALVRRWGGVRVFVPLPGHLDPGHEIAKVIGLDAAIRLAERFSGELPIPRAQKAILAARNASLLADRAAGKSHRDLALAYQLTERQVLNILREPPEPAPQQPLF